MDVPGTGEGGRKPLPGEHGFRFFPGFYRNLPDTMRRIPFPGNADGVRGNLRSGTEALFARGSSGHGRPDLHFPLRRATTPPAPGDITPSWIRDQILSALDLGTRLPAHEVAYFANRLLVHLTSCDARREDEWEKTSWWEFIRAGQMSEEYRTVLGVGQTRNLVATRAEVASTRTVGVAECWAQLKDALNDSGKTTLTDDDRLGWFMDPAVTGLGGPDPQNREQLLIHPTGTLYNRPTARTAVPNLFLAGDYIRTDVDLATMEGANESARLAVNALLDADDADAERCEIKELYRPPEMEPLKRVDETRYRLGLPNTFDLG